MTPSETYSCLMSAEFDWAADTDIRESGKTHRPQQAYMLITSQLNKVNNQEAAYPFKVVDTRLKVRGSGRVMVLRYESETGKDFELIGHATPFTVEDEG